MKIIQKIRERKDIYIAKAILHGSSAYKSIIYKLNRRDRIILKNEYAEGKPIAILALYEKGGLRNDIKRLIKVLKKYGLYIIAVNTLKIDDKEEISDIDCYIERYNFGRDFGSYKHAFMYVYKNKLHERCPRFIMLNDSVYYSSRNLENFIKDLLSTEKEFLGATENFEINYHLGSFCLSIHGDIVRNKKFRSYWKKYKLTDIRPRVIKNGEMKLTKTVLRCLKKDGSYGAVYDVDRFINTALNDEDFLNDVLYLSRSCSTAWPAFPKNDVVNDIIQNYYYKVDENIKLRKVNKKDKGVIIKTANDLVEYLMEISSNKDTSEIYNIVRDEIAGRYSDYLVIGSQIHSNATLFYKMGMPILKLDMIYRGTLNSYDVAKLLKLMPEDEALEFSDILFRRIYGAAAYKRGWKLAAFMRGLI